MRIFIFTLITFYFFMLPISNAQEGPQKSLDPDQKPQLGSSLMSEFSWSKWSPDYFSLEASIDIGSDDFIKLENEFRDLEDCKGYTTAIPHYQIEWYRQKINETKRLRIFFVAPTEPNTTLIITHEDGSIWCSKNALNTPHPMIDISHPRTGTYSIWIGTESPNTKIKGLLFFTLANYDLLKYPPLPTGAINFVGQGAGLIGTRFIYSGCIVGQTQLTLSVDAVVYNLSRGEEVRLILNDGKPYISDVYKAKSWGNITFDYSNDEYGAFEVKIPLRELDDDIDQIDFTLNIQLYNRSTNDWEDVLVDEYQSHCNMTKTQQ